MSIQLDSLVSVDSFLASRSFVDGFTASQADVALLNFLSNSDPSYADAGTMQRAGHANLSRWLSQVTSSTEEERGSWPQPANAISFQGSLPSCVQLSLTHYFFVCFSFRHARVVSLSLPPRLLHALFALPFHPFSLFVIIESLSSSVFAARGNSMNAHVCRKLLSCSSLFARAQMIRHNKTHQHHTHTHHRASFWC